MRPTLPGACLVLLSLVLTPLQGCGAPSDELLLVGTVERTLVELTAPVSEVVVLRVARAERLAPGAVVAQLDPTLATADVASAEAVLAMSRSALSVAREEHQRSQKLRKDRVISQQALDRAQLALDEASARQREAEARRAAALKRLADHTLESPVSGVVDQLPFESGERVSAGAVVAVIASDEAPWVRVWLPEHRLSQVALGATARVHIDGFAPLEGRLVEISLEPEYTPHFALTERERAYLVYEARVQIESAPANLRPGAPAEVTLVDAAPIAGVR